jgi:ribose 5-phosphate isomerase B
MKIYLGADHGGFHLKEEIGVYLTSKGLDVEDEGNTVLDPDDDYPQFAGKVAAKLLSSDNKEPRGILVCTGAQGVAIAANRFKGIRASVVWDEHEAKMTRNDNDSNVLCLPGRLMQNDKHLWQAILDTWLSTPFSNAPRHHRRVQELDELN